MKCKLIGQHLRVVSKSIRFLSKLSDIVLITTNSNGMKMQSLTELKTAFGQIQFDKNFFASFESSVDTKCRISLKALFLVFRTVNIDRIVDCCTIIMDETLPKVIFEMKCKKGVTREYFLPYMESEELRYSSHYNNKTPTFTADSKLLAQAFQHFAQYTRDITLWIQSNQILFKSFFEDDEQSENFFPMTTFSYKSNEFITYNFTEEISTTFDIKDLKSFLEFASYQNHCVNAFFEASGKPIEFTINTDGYYSASVMLATFNFPDDELPQHHSNQVSHTSFSVIGSCETSGNELNVKPNNANELNNSIHMPSNSVNSGRILNNFHTNSLSNTNVANNQTTNQNDDMFDDEDDDVFNQMLLEMPDFSRNESDESPERTNQTSFALTGSPLRRYHRNVLFGSEDENDFVVSSQDIIVPDSDEEQN